MFRAPGSFLAVVPLIAGCFQYVPVGVEQVPLGATVRTYVSAPAVERLKRATEGTAPGLASPRLVGELTRRTGEGIVLEVPLVVMDGDYRAATLVQGVDLQRGEILQVDLRRLNRPRTAVVAALAVVGAVVAWEVARGGTAGSTQPIPRNDGPPESVVGLSIARVAPLHLRVP